jgi:hypothetical protein
MTRSWRPRPVVGSRRLHSTCALGIIRSLPYRRLVDDIVFHAQQAAEKCFKAFLTWHQVPFR